MKPLLILVAALAFLPPPLSPPAAMGQLAAGEAAIRSGTVRFSSASRSVRWDGDVDEAAARAELERHGRDYGSAAGELRFAGDAWRQEAAFTRKAGVTTWVVTGAADGLRREVVTAASRARATLGPELPGVAALPNALLRARLSAMLKDVPWKSSRAAPDGNVVLSGEWQGRALALTLDPKHGCRAVALRVVTRRMGEDAPSSIAALQVEYPAAPGPSLPARVRVLQVSRLGEGATASLQDLRVEKASLNDADAAGLAVAIPRGAEVLDTRAGTAIYYEQGEQEPTPAEVREMVEKKIAAQAPPSPTGPKLNVPAPAVVLKDLEGREVRLADYRGKVVLLNWFASW